MHRPNLDAPIILVGMHRSGTSMTSRILSAYGVHMGATLSPTHESLFFQNLNSRIMRVLGYGWRCLDELFPDVRSLASGSGYLLSIIEEAVGSGLERTHLAGAPPGGPWGWKDPQTSLLLPLYLRAFPGARVVHVHRDGRDCALSLLQRDAKRFGFDALAPTVANRNRFARDFQLWEVYTRRCMEGLRRCGSAGLVMRYEGLLETPGEQLDRLASFCGLDPA
ncbi:MAG: sulfotransferase, partial [Desulfovibrionaceae bacterium]